MNSIVRLQTALATAQAEAAARDELIRAFRTHLLSSKFHGTDPDGSRRDWIAVADVDAWLVCLLMAGA